MEYPKLSDILKPSGYILFRPYCRHYATPYFEGITTIPEIEKVDSELYEIEQRQRTLERNIRKAKRLQVMGATEGDRIKAGAKIKDYQEEIRGIIKKNEELYRHSDRENPFFSEAHRLNMGVVLKIKENI